MRKGFGVVLASALWIGVLALPARAAEVHVNVNIGGPPPVYVYSAPPPVYVYPAPRLVYLAEPAVYVAVGIPYDIFFVGGRYYYYRGNDWYWGPGYGGPWRSVAYRSLPPGLRKFRVERLRDYRDREYRAYRVYDHPSSRGRGRGRH
jgi:hypothetical protein